MFGGLADEFLRDCAEIERLSEPSWWERVRAFWRSPSEPAFEPPASPPPPAVPERLRAHLDVLGLAAVPDLAGLQAARRSAQLRHHPDRGGSVEIAKRINQAFDALRKEIP